MTARGRRAARWAAVVAWTLFVWSRSLFDGPDSAAQSNVVVALVRPLLEALGVRDASLMSLLVRKAGHFCEYAVLGGLASWADGPRPVKAPLVRQAPLLALALAVAALDETIQLFVPGRTGSPRDVLIDGCGAAVGLVALGAARHAPRRRRQGPSQGPTPR